MFYLLQVAANVADTVNKVQAGANVVAEKISMIDLLSKGGWIMYPLYLLFAAAIFVFAERFIAIRKAGKIEDNFMSIIRDNIITGNISAARSLAKNTNNPVAKMIDKGLQRIGKPIDAIEKSMENVGKLEVYKMERNTSILSIIAGIAPMFGFLGTIFGVIKIFYNISITNDLNIANISDGLYQKMISSGAGLFVGIVAYAGYYILNGRIDKVVLRMDKASNDLLKEIRKYKRSQVN
jgi:biopolymer transport protein ExbB